MRGLTCSRLLGVVLAAACGPNSGGADAGPGDGGGMGGAGGVNVDGSAGGGGAPVTGGAGGGGTGGSAGTGGMGGTGGSAAIPATNPTRNAVLAGNGSRIAYPVAPGTGDPATPNRILVVDSAPT